MSKGIPGVGLSQTLSLVGFLFVAVVLSILGYRLTPPGGPPTVRARLLQRTAPVREVQPAHLVLITIDGLRTDRRSCPPRLLRFPRMPR